MFLILNYDQVRLKLKILIKKYLKYKLTCQCIPNANNSSNESINVLDGGCDKNSNLQILSIPSAFNCKITGVKSQRCNSGGVKSLRLR